MAATVALPIARLNARALERVPGSVFGIWGDAMLQERALAALTSFAFGADGEATRDFNFDSLDGESAKIADLGAATANLPFLAPKRVVLLRRAEKIEGLDRSSASSQAASTKATTKTSSAKKAVLSPAKRLEAVITQVPESTVLILARTPEIPEWGQKIEERCLNTALDRVIASNGLLINCALDPRAGAGAAAALLEEVARERSIALAPGAAAHLIERCGVDLWNAVNELEKCASSAGSARPVTSDIIDEMTRPALHNTVFDLLDAIGERRAANALALTRDLIGSGQAPEMMMGLITRHLRQLLQARALLDARLPLEASSLRRLPPELADQFPAQGRDNIAGSLASSWIARRLAAQARNFSSAQLIQGLELAFETDLALKGIAGDGGFESKHHSAAAFEIFIARLCAAAARR